MPQRRIPHDRRRVLAVPVAAIAAVAAAVTVAFVAGMAGCTPNDVRTDGHPSQPASANSRRTSGDAAPRTTPPSQVGSSQAGSVGSQTNQDPARYAPQVREDARATGINPQLLMAILYNESYKPHDPSMERAWQRLKPGAAFGVANMHEAAFDEVKKGRDFANRDWHELPDDPDLAIKAAAWYLHDLARQTPTTGPGAYTKDELLALGYNAGATSMRAFARGATPGQVAQAYLDNLRANWAAAGRAIGGS